MNPLNERKKKGFESNLALAGLLAGVVFTLASITKYYVMMNDYDRLIAYTVLGLLIIFASWGHERSVRTDNRLIEGFDKIEKNITALEDYIDDEWTSKQEPEKKVAA